MSTSKKIHAQLESQLLELNNQLDNTAWFRFFKKKELNATIKRIADLEHDIYRAHRHTW